MDIEDRKGGPVFASPGAEDSMAQEGLMMLDYATIHIAAAIVGNCDRFLNSDSEQRIARTALKVAKAVVEELRKDGELARKGKR